MKTGLALSGGAVRGLAHIGVLKYLQEKDININIVAGTSAGSIVGAFYAAGFDPREIEEIALEVRWRELIKYAAFPRIPRMGLINIEFLQKFLEKHLGKDITFQDLNKPFIICAVDVVKGEPIFIKSGNLIKAVMASCAIPGIFFPVELDGRLLVDGGVMHNIPTKALKDEGVQYIIAVNIDATADPNTTPHNILDVIYRSFYLMAQGRDQEDLKLANCQIQIDLGDIGMWDLSKKKTLMERGYREAEKCLHDMVISKKTWKDLLPWNLLSKS